MLRLLVESCEPLSRRLLEVANLNSYHNSLEGEGTLSDLASYIERYQSSGAVDASNASIGGLSCSARDFAPLVGV